MTYNIEVVSDGSGSSATTVMNNIAKHSKHNLTIIQWGAKYKPETDIVYFHYGGLLPGDGKQLAQIRKHTDKKYIAGIRGMNNFKRWGIHKGN